MKHKKWLKENWFKIGILTVALILVLTLYNLSIKKGNNSAVQNLASQISPKIELSEDRSYLFREDFDPKKIKVYGVAIGDSVSKIDPSTITENIDGNVAWIHTSNEVGYRIVDGKVVEIVLHTEELKRAGLQREEEILIRFGKPDKVENDDFLNGTRYYYISRGLIVGYVKISTGNDIMSVNILGK